jgi:hypothetical protein
MIARRRSAVKGTAPCDHVHHVPQPALRVGALPRGCRTGVCAAALERSSQLTPRAPSDSGQSCTAQGCSKSGTCKPKRRLLPPTVSEN